MIDIALKGNRAYWIWIAGLLLAIGAGLFFYVLQLKYGLALTGLSRDVSWGLYTGQMTFLVGVAAGGVMLVLPYYLHNVKEFGRITILGEFLAVSAIIMCFLFLFIHLGQPRRAFNVFLHPSPSSLLFWDGNILGGYCLLNVVIGWNVLEAERNGVAPPHWVKPLIYISIPMAFLIHTVTAYIYCGLPGRGYWLTAILAPRFLASAFCSGPAFLILLCFLLKKLVGFDPGEKAIGTLSKIVAYALIVNVFFFACEVFVAMYSNIPEHLDHLTYLFFGLHSHGGMIPWMWTSMIFMLIAIFLLLNPATRANHATLGIACGLLFVGTWIDKGMGMMAGGFVPNPLHQVTEYAPTIPEMVIALGVWATGLLVLTVLFKIAVGVKQEMMV